MKKWLLPVLLALLMLMTIAEAEMLVISGGSADRVHLRASPSQEAVSLGLYFTGAPVERLANLSGGWSRVRIGSETGYVLTEYLAKQAEEAFHTCMVDNTTSDWVNLRSGASFEAQPIGRLENGDLVALLGETASGWSYVQSGDVRGYVVTDFLVQGKQAPQDVFRWLAVGETPDGKIIYSCELHNGQTIYFVSDLEWPSFSQEDVNFDGQLDIVVVTARGATNQLCEFFVRSGDRYVMAQHPAIDHGLANHILYPSSGYVLSSMNNGYAGALYEECLFRWEGTELRLVRRATAECLREYRTEGMALVTVLHDRKVELTVYDFTGADSVLIHQEIVDMNSMNADKMHEMKQRLWQGLR